MDTDLQTLYDNQKGVAGTFLYYLHEKHDFNEKAFWAYYNCVISITQKSDKKLDNNISKAVVFTHSQILNHIIQHLSDNDLYEMINYPYDKIHLYIERLNTMIDGYFGGYIINESLFDEDLKNPKIS